MASKTNRSLQAKYKKSLVQKQERAAIEYAKPAYLSNKPMLRDIAASAQHMVKRVPIETVTVDDVMVLYNPSIHRAPKPVMWSAYVDCDNELIRP